MTDKNRIWIIGGLILIILVCCIVFMVIVGGATFLRISSTNSISPTVMIVEEKSAASPTPFQEEQIVLPTATPQEVEETATNTPAQPSPTFEEEIQVSSETLDTLTNTLVPINDLLDLAARFKGITDIPITTDLPVTPYEVGDRKSFWIANQDTSENSSIEAKLEYRTEHMYFWIEDGVEFDQKDLAELSETFESQIYPTNRDFFGSEWSPGVDGDPRLFILYAQDLGFSIAGYFSSADEYLPQAHEYSNAVELFLLNSDNIGLEEPFTYGVLAHEFQHMIHWYQDRNEDSWLNEGFSELAALLNGYYESGFDWAYMRDPDIQLNDWPNDPNKTIPHYGSSFLFVTYLLERFGNEAVQTIISHPENGLTSVDLALNELNITDPESGLPVHAEDVFIDWVLANYLQDTSVGDGRFTYRLYDDVPKPNDTEEFKVCPVSTQDRTVSQYGVDYISITCAGEYTLKFSGVPEVGVLPVDPHSGRYAFWSNKGDESDMTLTYAFDFRNHTGPLTLTYWTWYDLEEDYDYLYLTASADGQNWVIIDTPSGTSEDPSGNSYGWGYNGLSGGKSEPVWIQEKVDISQFAGQEVQMRFEYITDAAVNGEGFLLDDLAIPEIDYFDDFEDGNGGWNAQGWVRIQNSLPQTYRLAVIYKGDVTTVEYLTLSNDGVSLEIPIDIGGEVDEVVLVVTGTTRFTRQKANYEFSIVP